MRVEMARLSARLIRRTTKDCGNRGFSSVSSSFAVPEFAFHCVPRLLHISIWLLGLCCLFASAPHAFAQQTPLGEGTTPVAPSSKPSTSTPSNDTPLDVIIVITPRADNSAHIGLAYPKIVSHKRVRDEIARLTSNGWNVANNVVIQDSRKPATGMLPSSAMTLAQFILQNAPQVKDQSPEIKPYLQAFQDWNRLSINFFIPRLPQYRGVTDFQDKTVHVVLRTDQGGYSYDADIYQHQNALPDLLSASSSVTPPAVRDVTEKPVSSNKTLAWALIIAGVGISGGCLLYLLLTRRSTANVSTPSLRH